MLYWIGKTDYVRYNDMKCKKKGVIL
jgi:hypothetical protein